MASVRSPTSSVSSNLVTGSMAAHTQWGERDEALDRFGLTDFARLDRTEQGKEFIQLHLRDAYVVQEVAREGCGMIRHLDQPGQHRVGVHLEDVGDSANAKSFSQRPDGPHQLVG